MEKTKSGVEGLYDRKIRHRVLYMADTLVDGKWFEVSSTESPDGLDEQLKEVIFKKTGESL